MESDNLRHASLAAAATVRAVLLLAMAWFLIGSVFTGLTMLYNPLHPVFLLFTTVGIITDLLSIVIGMALLSKTLCAGASGLWSLPRGLWYILQTVTLLLSGLSLGLAFLFVNV